jgi:hypothetical protein
MKMLPNVKEGNIRYEIVDVAPSSTLQPRP